MAQKTAIELTFTKERETKNTVVYVEEGDTPQIGQIYLQKTSPLSSAESLKVTVEAQ